ncbi:MAG TPA: polysaccharide deacetylase family protein [Candidatus Acidoferrales bacterium]|nr:polysaccharide deacetylase family protein [Candidatus Acidoferrales bacterium]
MRPAAVVSVDVDPVDLHLVGYGFRGLPPDPSIYVHAMPRLLDVLARCGIRATLFMVGRDAEAQAAIVGGAVAAGHEIASHTWSHPIGFASLPVERQLHELADSKRALERAGGREVVGFRAPNFDMNAAAAARLAAAGYRYDASAYPSPMLVPARALLALKGRNPLGVLAMRPWPFTWRRTPFTWRLSGGSLREFPLAVTPGLRVPVYHTLRYYSDERRFGPQLDAFARRGELLSYVLHAVDALGLVEDGIDPRLHKHPGMDRALGPKLALLERSLRAVAERFDPMTYAELLG